MRSVGMLANSDSTGQEKVLARESRQDLGRLSLSLYLHRKLTPQGPSLYPTSTFYWPRAFKAVMAL